MKIKNVWVVVFVLLSVGARAQVQHVQGIQSVDAMYGKTRYGGVYSASYVRYLSNRMYLKGSVLFENGKDNEANIRYNSSGIDGFLAYTVFKMGEKFYFNGIGGVTVSSDRQTNATSSFGVSIPSTLKYGVLGGFEMETFISEKFVFVITGKQKLVVNGNFGSTRWEGSAGIRYNF